MLDLRRLRLLRELHERGTVAAVADALQFTPSAVSQQLAVLEREAGVPLLEKAGRGLRLTDAALVLVGHAEALLERAALAEADLSAAAGTVAGRGRIAAFESVALRIALPAIEALGRDAPRLRCELVEAEPEQALPALALGDLDLVLADEWSPQPRALPDGVVRHELPGDPVRLVLPASHPVAERYPEAVPLAELAREPWATGDPGMGWEEMTRRTCRALGGFDPDVRHRTAGATVALALVERGLAVTMLPALPLAARGAAAVRGVAAVRGAAAVRGVAAVRGAAAAAGADAGATGVAVREIAEGSVERTIFAATRAVDAERPSTRALLEAVQAAARATPAAA
jgi:DNA-binding transcriptional LysR family regulator